MFDNIGEKLKTLARVLFWVELCAFIISGLIIFADVGELDWGSFLCLFVGPIAAWVGNFAMYGFGELIDKVGKIERKLHSDENVSATQSKIHSDRIEKLEKLRSQDLITEEEYQEAVSKVEVY